MNAPDETSAGPGATMPDPTAQPRVFLSYARKDGEEFLCWIESSAVLDASGQRSHYVAVFTDITDKKRAEQELRYLANYDTLTSLPNRALLSERLSRAIVRARRQESRIAVAHIHQRVQQGREHSAQRVGNLSFFFDWSNQQQLIRPEPQRRQSVALYAAARWQRHLEGQRSAGCVRHLRAAAEHEVRVSRETGHRELSHEGALLLTKVAVRAEVAGQDLVRGGGEAQQLDQRRLGPRKQ